MKYMSPTQRIDVCVCASARAYDAAGIVQSFRKKGQFTLLRA